MGKVIVEIKNLSKRYKSGLALNHVNLHMEKGRIYGLIGKNGAGKTTLMRILDFNNPSPKEACMRRTV